MTDDVREYEVAVVGGGPAGLTAALYTTRLSHDTVVVNRGGGRAAMMADTHNVIGVTEEVSGKQLLQTAREQVRSYGADSVRDFVESAERLDDGRFRLAAGKADFVAERVVLATGFTDEQPPPPLPPTGRGLHYCLHCDAYSFVGEPVYVMGTGEAAAHVAMVLLNFTEDVDVLTLGAEPAWGDDTDRQLRAHPVEVIESDVVDVETGGDRWLEGFEFEDGRFREYRGGFPMYGRRYNNGLADQLGCDLDDDGSVLVDESGETSVEGVYAVGDLSPGHSQIPVAMGEGAKAGIDVHYALREFPRSLDEVESEGDVSSDEVPGISEQLREASSEDDAGDE